MTRRKVLPYALLAATLPLLLYGCWGSAGAHYSIENQSGSQLLTWVTWEKCDTNRGRRDEWFPAKVVPPGENVSYRYTWGCGGAPRCVYVATSDWHLVLAEPLVHYEYYVVTGSLHPAAQTVPDLEDESSPGWVEEAGRIGWFALLAALSAGLLAAVFIIVRFFYRYYVRRP